MAPTPKEAMARMIWMAMMATVMPIIPFSPTFSASLVIPPVSVAIIMPRPMTAAAISGAPAPPETTVTATAATMARQTPIQPKILPILPDLLASAVLSMNSLSFSTRSS